MRPPEFHSDLRLCKSACPTNYHNLFQFIAGQLYTSVAFVRGVVRVFFIFIVIKLIINRMPVSDNT